MAHFAEHQKHIPRWDTLNAAEDYRKGRLGIIVNLDCSPVGETSFVEKNHTGIANGPEMSAVMGVNATVRIEDGEWGGVRSF